MAEMEKALIDRLLADAPVAAILGTRAYFAIAPQRPVPPYAVIFRVSGARIHSLEKAGGLALPRVQLDCFAKTALSARELARACRVCLDGFRGTQSLVDVQAVLLLDEMDVYEETPELHRVSQDYRVWVRE